jgi:pyrroloquinoline quinone biosynthesis protein B
MSLTPVSVPGKLPVHLMGQAPAAEQDNIGLVIRSEGGGPSLGYFPAVAGPSAALRDGIAECGAIFFDGTFWSEDELPAAGIGKAGARDMAHWPVGGPDGGLAYLSAFPAARRVFIHINNSNPMLREGSPEQWRVLGAGMEVAWDGMEFAL